MQVRFLGVRGSIPVSGEAFASTGGNTTSLLLEAEGRRLLIDGGTGLAALGQQLGFTAMDTTILFTHVHWDHIQGVPFFAPLFHPGSRIRLVGARTEYGGIAESLSAQMRPPQFPIGLDAFKAQMEFIDLEPRRILQIGPFRIEAIEMTHPNGVLVYRVTAGGRTVVFATDIEHGDQVDERLVRFSEGTDLLIHDAQYHASEYRGENGPPRRGWGHSTWEDAITVGQRSGARRTALFHHDPTRDDAGVARMEEQARERWSSTFAARQDQVVSL